MINEAVHARTRAMAPVTSVASSVQSRPLGVPLGATKFKVTVAPPAEEGTAASEVRDQHFRSERVTVCLGRRVMKAAMAVICDSACEGW